MGAEVVAGKVIKHLLVEEGEEMVQTVAMVIQKMVI
jgi:hypothetical protein